MLLTLYSLDSQLTEARARVARVRERLAAVEHERDRAQVHLGIAKRTLRAAQDNLADSLRGLYRQHDDFGPLAVLLGAASLTDVVDNFENLERTARRHQHIASEAKRARQRVRRLVADLRARAAETRALEAEAEAAAASLAEAQTERAAYLSQVRAERRLTAEQLSIAEAEARAAEARAREAAAARAATASFAAVVTPAPAPAAPPDGEEPAEPEAPAAPEEPAAAPEPEPEAEPEPPADPAPQAAPAAGRTLTVTSTAYSGGGLTATGIPVGWGVVAVDPSVIPLGTRMTIPGYGEGVAADTGSAVSGLMIDVWMPTEEEASAWGVRTVTITIH